ncbi:CoA-binding protein [Ignavibacterium sp.]|uniref:CoA-binding protein n=1 Tax=Ignavibacterium sp. TaxID=2651167 RepID=UPI00307EED31
MNSKISIDSFLSKKNIAVVEVSSKGKGFGTAVFSHLKKNEFNVFGVNINGGIYENEKLYKSLTLMPEKIDAVVTVVPSVETEKVITEANELRIKDIWMQ